MNKQVMKPYSIYLPEEYIARIKEHAKDRKAATFVRDALISALNEDDQFTAGYNKGLSDAKRVITKNNVLDFIAYKGEYIADILSCEIDELKVNK